MKTLIRAVALLAASTSLAFSATWGTDFEAAKAAAAKDKRPILVNFTGSDWCGWCVRLDKEVFSQKAFKDFAANKLVLLELDFPQKKELPAKLTKQNKELMAKYKIEGFPTILLIDAKGKVLATTGYQEGGAEAYVKHLQQLIERSELD